MARMIINLTQHAATPEQIAQGVVDLPPELRVTLAKLLTFDAIPVPYDVELRAVAIAKLTGDWLETQPRPKDYGVDGAALAEAMIDCPAYLQHPLVYSLMELAIEPVFAFSNPDASHAGFVRMFAELPF